MLSEETIDMQKLLEQRLLEARNGRYLWLDLKSQYNLDDSAYVLLIPDADEDIGHLIEGFIKYIKKKHGHTGLIVVPEKIQQKLLLYCKKSGQLEIHTCTKKQVDELIRFYCMYQFTGNLLIASLTKPDGRRGELLVGKKGMGRQEILDMVVFGLETDNGQEKQK